MNEPPFHATRAGQKFIESTLPQLVEELARINGSLAELIETLEKTNKAIAAKLEKDEPR